MSNVSSVVRAHPLADWKTVAKASIWPEFKSGRGELSVIDLFSGCGGLSLGAYLAAEELELSFKVRLAIDCWSPALDVYRSNFGRFARDIVCGDVRNLNPQSVSDVDLLMAGPPCQGHSDLNNSTRRNDERNELYFVAAKFAAECRSRLVLIENVPSVVHSKQKVVQRSAKLLERSGYAVDQLLIDISNIGIPQQRKRHLLVASLDHSFAELRGVMTKISALRQRPAVLEFISDIQDSPGLHLTVDRVTRMSSENIRRIDYLFDNDVYDLPDDMRPPCHRDKAHTYSSMYGRMKPDRPAQTITSGFGSMGQGRFVHPTRRRTITAHEAARIQGFPDFFDFSNVSNLTSLREMIANAVPPALCMLMVKSLLKKQTKSKIRAA